MAHAETDTKGGAGRSLPANFPERGAYLPFTTPELTHARVRERGTSAVTEIVIPRLIGSLRTHVVALRTLRETFSLSVHDRALYEQIMATRATTPAKIARIADRLAQDGLAGADEMRRSRAARSAHKSARLRLFMYLVGAAIEQLCDDEELKSTITPGTITSADGLDKACRALSPFAEQHDLSGQDLIDRLEKWARVTACVGSVRGEIPGYLARTAEEMAAFAEKLEAWLRAEPEESAELAEWVVKACRNTLSYSGELLERINRPATVIGASLVDFDATFRDLCGDVEKLIWLNDGWGPLVRRWNAVGNANRFAQRDALEELVRYLPLLPNDLLKDGDTALWRRFQKRQLNWQKNTHSRLRQPDKKPGAGAAATAAM